MPHQAEEFKHHLKHRFSATFSETGAGKTYPLLAATEFRFQLNLINKCLYTAPNSILEKIADEIILGTDLSYTILQASTRKKRLPLFLQDSDIHIINYEAVPLFEEELQANHYECIIADEAHRIKGYNNKSAKALQRLGKNARFKIVATGTPLCRGPEDMYGIYRFLDQRIFGTRVKDFRSTWCKRVIMVVGWGPTERSFEKTVGIKEDKEKEFKSQCMQLAILHQKKNCLKLPPKFEEIRNIELTTKLKSAYNKLRKSGILSLPSGKILEMSGSPYQKLSQICSGFVYVKDGKTRIAEHLAESAKLQELDEILHERSHNKTVIWCRQSESIDMIINRYPHLNPVCQRGQHDNVASRKIFQEDANCKIIVSQLGISEGYELTASDCAIYFELPYRWQFYQQSLDRIHRPGSEKHKQIMYFYLLTKGTVEKSLFKILKDRKDLASIGREHEEAITTGIYG